MSRSVAVPSHRAAGRARRLALGLAVVLMMLTQSGSVQAGKLSWLDDVVRNVIVEAKSGAKGVVRGGNGTRAEVRSAGRLFIVHDADESLERLVRRSEELRAAHGRSSRQRKRCSRPGFRGCSSETHRPSAPSHRSIRQRNGWSSSSVKPLSSSRVGIPTKRKRW